MKETKKKQVVCTKILELSFVLLCLGGFLYQTSEFLLLYWTYPTVVDIQQIDPSYLEMPAFSICNPIGYNFTSLCDDFEVAACLPSALNRFAANKFCRKFPMVCFNDSMPSDFEIVSYTKFMAETQLAPEDHEKLKIKLEDYMECTIEFAGERRKCNLDNVMGSFYSKEDMPQYCYTIYSLWGQPDKKRATIAKGAVMHFHFEVNTTLRANSYVPGTIPMPKHNIPGNPSVQIAVHSPYFLPSPFLDGMSYLAGRAYELRPKMSERHLLPSPYQTNCTDYMKTWRERGGMGPINQMGIVQECRINKTYASVGCIPMSLDYPHRYDICRSCDEKNPCNYSTFAEECGKLVDTYTQPCDSISYTTTREDRVISTNEAIESPFLGIHETLRRKMIAYDCEATRVWKKECGTIDVYVLFDRFEITNLTYNPKFESLELFSVIGGYMGMWLGISLLNVYGFFGSAILFIKEYRQKRKEEKTKLKKMKRNSFHHRQDHHYSTNDYRRARRRDIW